MLRAKLQRRRLIGTMTLQKQFRKIGEDTSGNVLLRAKNNIETNFLGFEVHIMAFAGEGMDNRVFL